MTQTNLEKCSLCGLCKAYCPVYNVILSETNGPRGKAILIKKNISDEIFYTCSLCKSCDKECPAGIELSREIRNRREHLVGEGKETNANREMIENIRKFGNPFGKIAKGEIPKKLYCC